MKKKKKKMMMMMIDKCYNMLDEMVAEQNIQIISSRTSVKNMTEFGRTT